MDVGQTIVSVAAIAAIAFLFWRYGRDWATQQDNKRVEKENRFLWDKVDEQVDDICELEARIEKLEARIRRVLEECGDPTDYQEPICGVVAGIVAAAQDDAKGD